MKSAATKMSKDSQLTPHQRSDDEPFLFMFVTKDKERVLLYKIDVFRLFRNNIREEALFPLMFFKRRALPDIRYSFAFIKPNFYIVGEGRDEVYTLNKYEICNLDPSEKRCGGEFLNRVKTPMLGVKSDPLAFAYNDNLYVISKQGSQDGPQKYSLEVYSPLNNTWTDLFPKLLWKSSINSHVILGNMVYFTMSNQTVMSFNLRISKWSTIYDPYGVLYIYKHLYPQYNITPLPTFDSQILVFASTVLGGVRCSEAAHNFDIFASQSLKPCEKEFLRPTLTPIIDSCNAFDTSDTNPLLYSKHMVNMGVQQVNMGVQGLMCVVCYGDLPSLDRSNHAVLHFYNVSNDPHQFISSSGTPTQVPLGDLFQEDGQNVNYWKAEFLGTTRLPIHHLPTKTRKKSTRGNCLTCFLV